MNEADTCRKAVRPKLEPAGWDDPPHAYNEQVSFTDGRIVVAVNKVRRRKQKLDSIVKSVLNDACSGVV